MTIFGVPWDDLTLGDVTTFFQHAGDEGLLWEAKSGTIHPDAVRRTACAFANGDQAGYLVLGAHQDVRGGPWRFDGVALPDEAPIWISNVIAGGSVAPLPFFDVKAWAAKGSPATMVVVRVDPTPVPPCTFAGTVFERLPGKSIPVRDSLRLLDLTTRGRFAHTAAEGAVRSSTESHLYFPEGSGLAVRVALRAVGYPTNLSRRLFSRAFAEQLRVELAGAGVDAVGIDAVEHSQGDVTMGARQVVGKLRAWWDLAISTDGVVLCRWSVDGTEHLLPTDDPTAADVFRVTLPSLLRVSEGLARALHGSGPVYAGIVLLGAFQPKGSRGDRLVAFRGPANQLDQRVAESLIREIDRARGDGVVYEPED